MRFLRWLACVGLLQVPVSAFFVCYGFFGFVNDRGWTYVHNLARAWADAELGSTSQYEQGLGLVMDDAGRSEVLQGFIDDGCDLIVTGSDVLLPVTQKFAEMYPNTRFMCLAGTAQLDNLGGAYVRVYQGYYLAGALAALQKRINEAGEEVPIRSLGYIGSMYFPDSIRNVNAFYLGAKSVGFTGKFYVLHTGSWFDTRMERIAGLRLMHLYDVDVITYDSDSVELIKLANEEGRYSIAAKADGTALFGESNLASTIYVWNDIFVNFVSAAMSDQATWMAKKDSTLFVGYEHNAVSLGTLSIDVGAAARLHLVKERQKFRAGNDTVFCPLGGVFATNCPPGANEIGNSQGALPIPATWIHPCNSSMASHSPPAGDTCLSDLQLRTMTYFIDGIIDLGLQNVPVQCTAGTKMDALAPDLCVKCPPGTYTDAADLTECLTCPAGKATDEENATACKDCSPGFYRTSAMSALACAKCQSGEFADRYGAVTCSLCAAGTYNDQPGENCKECAAGTFANGSGMSTCSPCGGGTFQDALGRAECNPCPVGHFGAGIAMGTCSMCAPSTYQANTGQTKCLECGDSVIGSSSQRGAASATECLCPEGTHLFRKKCISCETGLKCSGGLESPLQTRGHYAQQRSDGAFEVFRCGAGIFCPADMATGSCPEGRDGIACDVCQAGRFAAGDGTCSHCTDASGWLNGTIIILAVILVLFMLFALTKGKQIGVRPALLTIGTCCGVSLTSLQALGAFAGLQIEWLEPIVSLQAILDLFSFDIDILQASCLAGLSSPVSKYMGSLCILPLLALLIISFSFVFRSIGITVHVHDVLNPIGVIFLVGYLPITMLSLAPFRCMNNFGAPQTMVKYRSVICDYGREHGVLVVLAVIAFCIYSIGFMALVIWSTVVYQSRLLQPSGVLFMKKFAFLFQRFAPPRHWYGLLYIMRNSWIAIVPSVLSNEIEAQVMLLTFVILVFLIIQCYSWPWRTDLSNVVDTVFSTGLLMFMSGGCILLESTTGHSHDVLQIFFFSAFISMFGGVVVTVSYQAYRVFLPPKRYGLFLCHHKGGAAVLARYFKEVISDMVHDRIFLDSDELDALDLIFETVAEDTKNLVVLLSEEVLLRMWCAGEIHSAVKHCINIIPVKCSSEFKFLTDDFLSNDLAEVWTAQQKVDLASFGIEIHHIQESYRRLREIDSVSFPRGGTNDEQESALAAVVKRGVGLSSKMFSMNKSDSRTSQAEKPMVVIIGNPQDDESMCACRVLRRLLTLKLVVPIQVIHSTDDFQAAMSSSLMYVLVTLTRGILENCSLAEIFLVAKGVELVTILADTSFSFPNSVFYDRLAAGDILRTDENIVQRMGLPWVAGRYRALFNGMALRFSGDASSHIQNAEVMAIAKRLVLDKTASERRMEPDEELDKEKAAKEKTFDIMV